ncbi:kinase A anchor protein [Xylaria bambusicola]|uniref:kinase A anchor protein n=1 Tax=Xylaria bambusicola TaxID=326684 RepID=UPI0020077691|nr:kinase A anchor protein [Xylaria bambusicola]KAI0513207.1 kinase A anchor protein [Xylaria bambusicola]
MPPKPIPTHFLCIPLVTATSRQQLGASLSSFRADVTSLESFGVPDQAIRPIGTLHLTLGVMRFPEDEGLEKAVALLRSIIPRQLLADIAVSPPAVEEGNGTGPLPSTLSVTLKGLHSMQSPAKASVLYAPPVDSGSLTKFCEKLRSVFQDAGLMMEDNRPLLLHATILNTIYVKGKGASRGGKGKGRERLTIDARQILDRYDDYVWIENSPVEKVAICKMGAKKQENGDEIYEVEAEIDVV